MPNAIKIQSDPNSMATPIETIANHTQIPSELLLLLPFFYYQSMDGFATDWLDLPTYLNGWLLGLNQALIQQETSLSIEHIELLESYLPYSDQQSSYSDTFVLVLNQDSLACSIFLESPVPEEWSLVQYTFKRSLKIPNRFEYNQRVMIIKSEYTPCIQLALDTFNALPVASMTREELFKHIYYLAGFLDLLKKSVGFSVGSLLFFQLLIRHQIPLLPLLSGKNLWSSSIKSLQERIGKSEDMDLSRKKMEQFIQKLSGSVWKGYLAWAVISATPLHRAILELLLKHPNTKGLSPSTFLTYASYYNNLFAVKQLRDSEVFSSEHETNDEFSALAWARQLGHEEIASLLESDTSSAVASTSSEGASTSLAFPGLEYLSDSYLPIRYQPLSTQVSTALGWLQSQYRFQCRKQPLDALILAQTYVALRIVGNIIPNWPEKLALCLAQLKAVKNTFDFSIPTERSIQPPSLQGLTDVDPKVTLIFRNLEILNTYKSAADYLGKKPENPDQSFVEQNKAVRIYCNLLLFKSSKITASNVPVDALRMTILFQEILEKEHRNFFVEFFYLIAPFAFDAQQAKRCYDLFFKYLELNKQARSSLFRLLFDSNNFITSLSDNPGFTQQLYNWIWNRHLGELIEYLDKKQGQDFSNALTRVMSSVGAARRHILFPAMLIKVTATDLLKRASVTSVYLKTIEYNELQELSETQLKFCQTEIRQKATDYINRFHIFFPADNSRSRYLPGSNIDMQKLITFFNGIFSYYLSESNQELETRSSLELAKLISLFSKNDYKHYFNFNNYGEQRFFADLFQPFLLADGPKRDPWLRAVLHATSSLGYAQTHNRNWLAFLQDHRGLLADFAIRAANLAVTEQYTFVHFTLSENEEDGGLGSLMALARSVVEHNSFFSTANMLPWIVKYAESVQKKIPFHEQFSKEEIKAFLIEPIKNKPEEGHYGAIQEFKALFQLMLRLDNDQQESFYDKVLNHPGLSQLLIKSFTMIDFKFYPQLNISASPGVRLLAEHLIADDTVSVEDKLSFFIRCQECLREIFKPFTEALLEQGNEEVFNKMIDFMRTYGDLDIKKAVSFMNCLKPENRVLFLIATLNWCHKNNSKIFGELQEKTRGDFFRSPGPKMQHINSILSVVQPNEWVMLQQQLTNANPEFKIWLKGICSRHDEMKMALKSKFAIAESSTPSI